MDHFLVNFWVIEFTGLDFVSIAQLTIFIAVFPLFSINVVCRIYLVELFIAFEITDLVVCVLFPEECFEDFIEVSLVNCFLGLFFDLFLLFL